MPALTHTPTSEIFIHVLMSQGSIHGLYFCNTYSKFLIVLPQPGLQEEEDTRKGVIARVKEVASQSPDCLHGAAHVTHPSPAQ